MTARAWCSGTRRKSLLKLDFRSAIWKNTLYLSKTFPSTTSETLWAFYRNRLALSFSIPTLLSVQYTVRLYTAPGRTMALPFHICTVCSTNLGRTLRNITTKMRTRLMNMAVHHLLSSALFKYFLRKPLRHRREPLLLPTPYVPFSSTAPKNIGERSSKADSL